MLEVKALGPGPDNWVMAGPSLPARLAAALAAFTAPSAHRAWLPRPAHGAQRPSPEAPTPAAAATAPEVLTRATPDALADAADAVARVAFDDRLERALQPASSVEQVLEVASRAVAAIEPLAPTELLLAHPISGRLAQVLEVGPDGEGPGCPVTGADGCEALRTGRAQVYDDADSLDACPHLRDRLDGPCSAACVPLVLVGRPIGVLHRSGPPGEPPGRVAVAQLGSLAVRVGSRLALLRALDAPAPPTVDRATGALDRASVEARVLELARNLVPFCLAQCDLDRFDGYAAAFGPEVAARALRTVAVAMGETLRPDDLLGRFGDDELLLVLPETSAGEAERALERVREHVALCLTAAGLPPLTASFGLVESSLGRSLDELLVAADAAVTLAKDRGRNRVVVAGENMLDAYPGQHPGVA